MRFVRISESDVDAVRAEAEPLRDEVTGSLDIPGIYVAETGTSYRVMWNALERDARGNPIRRQRAKNFRRLAEYPAVTLPDFGRVERPSALQYAYSFKLKMDAAAQSPIVRRSDAMNVEDLFEAFMTSC